MSIARVILGLAAGAAGWVLSRQLKKLQNEINSNVDTASPHQHRKRHNSHSAPQLMLECRHCGVHFPADDAIRRNGEAFCCAEHATLPPHP